MSISLNVQKLTPNCRDAFLQKCDAMTILQLAVNSPKARDLISKSPVKLHIEYLDFSVDAPTLTVRNCGQPADATDGRPEFRPEDDVVRRIASEMGHENGSARVRILLLLKYLVDNFECVISEIFIDPPFMPTFVQLFYRTARHSRFTPFKVAIPMSTAIIDELADLVGVETLFDDLDTNRVFPEEPELRFRHIQLEYWLKGGERPSLQSSYVLFQETLTRDIHLNAFLKDWQSATGGYRVLNELKVYKLPMIYWDRAIIFDGVDVQQVGNMRAPLQYLIRRKGDDSVVGAITLVHEMHFWLRAAKWTPRLEAEALKLFGSTRPPVDAVCAQGFGPYTKNFFFNPNYDTFEADRL